MGYRYYFNTIKKDYAKELKTMSMNSLIENHRPSEEADYFCITTFDEGNQFCFGKGLDREELIEKGFLTPLLKDEIHLSLEEEEIWNISEEGVLLVARELKEDLCRLLEKFVKNIKETLEDSDEKNLGSALAYTSTNELAWRLPIENMFNFNSEGPLMRGYTYETALINLMAFFRSKKEDECFILYAY